MASIFPSDIEAIDGPRYQNDELATLIGLRDGLPKSYRVYHSVHWSRSNPQRTAFGEVDFVIVSPAGHVLVIEQKNGPLEETPQGLEKHYQGGNKKLVCSQVQRNLSALRDKFKAQNPQSPSLMFDYLIFCPEYRVVDVNAAGIDKRRTVDATSAASLSDRIDSLMATDHSDNPILVRELHNFLLGSFRIAPDVNTFKTNQRRVYRQLLNGLSEIIDSLDFHPFRLRIVGTAGSGKTQVTIRYCEKALAEGKSPLLLCFNRPLADRLMELAPDGVTVNTYHGFCKEAAESVGIELDFSQTDDPNFWRNAQEQLVSADLSAAPRYDCLVVDEGQDFKDEWYEILQLFLNEDATQLWLEDPLQNLRGIEPVSLPGFVTYREKANFRTPTTIASFIKAALGVQFEERNSLPGLGVALYEYNEDLELKQTVNSRVIELVKVGFKPEDIVIISCRGMQSTALAGVGQFGKHAVRRFTGEYDINHEQIYTDGDLRFETIYRFKGQQAPAVILVDMDQNLERNEQKSAVLYCAMTRATVRLELVVRKNCPWLSSFRDNVDQN